MRFYMSIFPTTVMLIAASIVLAAVPQPNQESSSLVSLTRSLKNKNFIDQQPALGKILVVRRRLARTLIDEISDPDKSTRRAAMFLMGIWRLSDGVPNLIQKITSQFVVPENAAQMVGPTHHPAVQALIRIGMPSIHAILKALPGESNALRRKLMVQVMIGVEGKAVSRFRLQGLKAKQQNPQFQAHLAAALKDLEQAQGGAKGGS